MSDKNKNILIIGAAARDHALAWKLSQSSRIGKIYVAPGNGGTNKVATNVDIAASDYDGLLKFAKEKSIDIVFPSSEDQLGDGLVDLCQKAGIAAFGPTQQAAQIETSKTFSKDFMNAHEIPTANYRTFDNYEEAKSYLSDQQAPIVIKASGLVGGKGAVVCRTMSEAESTLKEMMQDKKFGEAGMEVVIEDFMSGPEISIHAFSDGTNYHVFPPSQDHKTIGEGNTGLNTGGMGVIAPLAGVSPQLMQQVENKIVAPVIDGLKEKGTPFVGMLYPGIMITNGGAKVIEYNARPGDPENQNYMRLLETDLLEIIKACINGNLDQIDIKWSNKTVANIILVSGGYPEKYEVGFLISGIETAEQDPDVIVFQAGTTTKDGELVTNGGRVLSVTAQGDDLDDALAKAYRAADKIEFTGKNLRRDIGKAHDNSKLKGF